MASSKLHPCPDCGNNISRRARVCLHCGREMVLSPWSICVRALRFAFVATLLWVTAAAGVVAWRAYERM
jgi:hypothetical protein